jgi:tRNA dimethylallyltransferase
LQIDNLFQSSKIPIIVGGTNYYIESILWQNLISPKVGFKRKNCDNIDNIEIDSLTSEVKEFIENPSIVEVMEKMESKILHEYLKQIDPLMAHRLHPNNKRKIMR